MAQALRDDVLRGLERASDEDVPARLITLTGRPGGVPLADFNRAFTRLASNLARAGLRWDHHIAVLGCDPHGGHLHRHVVTLGGPYIDRDVLSEYATRVGLGEVVDIRRITPSGRGRARVAGYIARNALDFAAAHTNSGVRIAPVSRSRGHRSSS